MAPVVGSDQGPLLSRAGFGQHAQTLRRIERKLYSSFLKNIAGFVLPT